MNKVEIKFINSGTLRGGILFLKSYDAIKFIEECQLQKIEILGIDSFIITEDSTQPLMEKSVDISNRPFIDEDYEKLIEFISVIKENLYFEVVCKG